MLVPGQPPRTSHFNSRLIAARSQPRSRRSCAGLEFCTHRRGGSRFRECRCAATDGTPHVAFHDSYLWALSPGGQRAHALVDGGTGTGHPCSGFWVRIGGEPGAYGAQSGRRASHIAGYP